MTEQQLVVSFIGEDRVLDPGDTLSFGRAADLVIDEDNPYLHRVVGRVRDHNGVWWLENVGSHIVLELVSHGGTVVRVPPTAPGATPSLAPIPGGPSVLGFEVAGARYELELDAPGPLPTDGPPQAADDTATLGYGRIDLTDEEHALLVRLAAPILRDPNNGPDTLPTNKEIAHQLGWPITKFNRKLDFLCVRLTKAGVRGLQGGRGAEASNRRWRLVEHAIATRLVTTPDVTD